MLILWSCLITATLAQKVFDSTEDIGPEAFLNVTTLYPITNNTTQPNTNDNITSNDNSITNYIKDKETDKENNDIDSNNNKTKADSTTWKIEATFAESKFEKQEKENGTSSEVKTDKRNVTKEFRPSPHLGSFYDEDSLHLTPTKASFGSFMPVKKPSSGFVSSTKDEYNYFNKLPKTMLQTHKQYPYKFESPILTKVKNPWGSDRPDSLESKPTAEVPVKIPAGGFYKYEDPFREKPTIDNEDFSLGFNEDGKDISIKKRINPWENFFRLVTAFLPVGLIISALTPSIVTIENTGPGIQKAPYPSNIFRRSDPGIAEVPVISEPCRRRLLCELRSEQHSTSYKSPYNLPYSHGKQCFKIHCEDTEVLARTLQWLLEYRESVLKDYNT